MSYYTSPPRIARALLQFNGVAYAGLTTPILGPVAAQGYRIVGYHAGYGTFGGVYPAAPFYAQFYLHTSAGAALSEIMASNATLGGWAAIPPPGIVAPVNTGISLTTVGSFGGGVGFGGYVTLYYYLDDIT